ncbi:hypothetical protein K493DRAFT_318281, partial [Basidiobolus meristosporus CBS 931.73]
MIPQIACNGALGRLTAKSFAALTSFGVGLMPLLLYFMVETRANTHPALSSDAFHGAPWWGWIGGVLGVVYIFSQVVSIPKIGAANYVAVVVPTQIIITMLMDHFALVGVNKRSLTWERGVGCLGMIFSVFLITRNSGAAQTVPSGRQNSTAAMEVESLAEEGSNHNVCHEIEC